MREIQLKPVYGENYKKGYLFFTKTSGSFISDGITFFTFDDKLGKQYPQVSHVGLVTGENKTLEALDEGVVESDLEKYFNNPKCKIFFRRPRYYNPLIADELVAIAEGIASRHLKYGYKLIVAHGFNRLLIGKILGTLTRGYFNKILYKILDGNNEAICSEFISMVFQAHPKFQLIGCMRRPARENSPQHIMEDDGLLAPWKPNLTEEEMAQQLLTKKA